jgi:hypothetical protein
MTIKCEVCEKGEVVKVSSWHRYKTPFNRRLSSEQPIYGDLFKCDNEECEERFYNDEENEELQQGYPC